MAMHPRGQDSDADRLLVVLHRLLGLQHVGRTRALDAAAQAVAEAMGADKADVFLHEPTAEALVAAGTSDTPMSRHQTELGLDRLALADGGTAVGVFRTGRSALGRHLDQDPAELRGVIEGLGVRSQIAVPLEVNGQRRGVLLVCSATPGRFTARDLRFVETVAHWVGLVSSEAERLAHPAAGPGVETLTPRQRDVAACIAEGLTNAEIAERLVVVEGTVANHVEAILGRLGFKSRTQIGVWAAGRGLRRPPPA